jgi:hypothetical protein
LLTEEEKIEIQNSVPEAIGERYPDMSVTYEARL